MSATSNGQATRRNGAPPPADRDAEETTALLQPRDDETGSSGGGDDLTWDGYKDFEGLPWWRRPSVRPCSMLASMPKGKLDKS